MIRIQQQKESYWCVGYLIQFNKPTVFGPFKDLEEVLDWEFPSVCPDYYYIFRVSRHGDHYIKYKRTKHGWKLIIPAIKYNQKEKIPSNIKWVK